MSANRVMKSVTSWLERKLFLKVSSTKTKVVRPMKSNFLEFTYFKNSDKWDCRPSNKSKMSLYDKCRKELIRKVCIARPNAIRLRQKIRAIILKQWKKPLRIHKNLRLLNNKLPYQFTEEQLFSIANSRLGWYRRASNNIINFLLNADVLAIRKGDRPGLVNPLKYYLG